MSAFDELLKNKQYQEILNTLPEDERESIIKTLREVVESFEKNVLESIEILKQK